MITPNTAPEATCHSGMVGGRIRGNRKPVTKNPSLISCPRTQAKTTSTTPPAANPMMKIGRK
jgi:hypothetical protein